MRLAHRLFALLAAALLAGCAARPVPAAAPVAAGDAVIAAESRLLDAVSRNELPAAMARFAAAVPVGSPPVADLSGAVGDRHGVTALPTTYFIAGDGTIGAIHLDALTPEVLDDRLEAIE